MSQTKKPAIIDLLCVIVSRGTGNKVVKILDALKVDFQLLSLGQGTADSSMAEYFNLDAKEKEVVFAIIKTKNENLILANLNKLLKLEEKNTGIAATIPIKSATYSLVEQMGFEF